MLDTEHRYKYKYSIFKGVKGPVVCIDEFPYAYNLIKMLEGVGPLLRPRQNVSISYLCH